MVVVLPSLLHQISPIKVIFFIRFRRVRLWIFNFSETLKMGNYMEYSPIRDAFAYQLGFSKVYICELLDEKDYHPIY